MLNTIDLTEASRLFANYLSDSSSLDVKLASKIIPKLILNLMVLKSVQAEEMPKHLGFVPYIVPGNLIDIALLLRSMSTFIRYCGRAW